MIRIGFIGCGGVAREYLNRLEQRPDRARLVAVCDLDTQRAAALAAAHGARVYHDHREMLSNEALDAVFDNLPPFARADELILAAEHGLAIFTTKPLGLSLEPAARTLTAIEAAGVMNSAGYVFRYSGITERARALLAGRPVALLLGRILGATPSGWTSRRALSGGQIVEQSTHLVDLARYFAGEVQSIQALGGSGHVPERVDYEDVSALNLSFTGGAIGSIVSTCAIRQFFWGFTLIARDLHLELVFDEWTLRGVVDGTAIDLRDSSTGYQEQIDTFLEAVERRDQSLIRSSYRDALRTLVTTLTANRALASGLPEPVPSRP